MAMWTDSRSVLWCSPCSIVSLLIEKGYVYIAETPLYEINTKGGKGSKKAPKTYFAYTDKERDDIVKKLEGKCSIQRSKGLGENEPEMMWQTTMNPETRRLIRVKNPAKYSICCWETTSRAERTISPSTAANIWISPM